MIVLCLLQEFDRPNSAYMLFYERSESMEPADQPAISTPAPSQATAEAAPQQEAASMQPQAASPVQSQQGTSLQPQEGLPSQLEAGFTGQSQDSRIMQSPDVHMSQGDARPVAEQSQSAPAEVQDEDLPSVPPSPQVMQTSPSPAATRRPQAMVSSVSPLKVWPISEHSPAHKQHTLHCVLCM